jgi:hypothetical protein
MKNGYGALTNERLRVLEGLCDMWEQRSNGDPFASVDGLAAFASLAEALAAIHRMRDDAAMLTAERDGLRRSVELLTEENAQLGRELQANYLHWPENQKALAALRWQVEHHGCAAAHLGETTYECNVQEPCGLCRLRAERDAARTRIGELEACLAEADNILEDCWLKLEPKFVGDPVRMRVAEYLDKAVERTPAGEPQGEKRQQKGEE